MELDNHTSFDSEWFEYTLNKYFPNIRKDFKLSPTNLGSTYNTRVISDKAGYSVFTDDGTERTYKQLAEYLIKNKHMYEWWLL